MAETSAKTRGARHRAALRADPLALLVRHKSRFGISEFNLTKSDFWIMDTPSRSFQRGRLAIVTDAGRDAVDADGATDESAARGRRSRVVLTPSRWCQVGGDKPLTTVAKERGMPGVSGVTVVTTLVCFFNFARKAAGASRARHSLRPLGRKINAKPGRIAPRECEVILSQRHARSNAGVAGEWVIYLPHIPPSS
jgi:hypothetical protein